ncbi:MAG: RNA polymerase sigma factor [Planctomycetes bacterium]|nr:RNA polymerase sigma factor [Planctomycetota bacterium]
MKLVDEHGPALAALLRRLCRNAHDADDVFQETALRVWRALPGVPRVHNPRAWLLTIGYRTFLDSRQRRPSHESFAESPDPRVVAPSDQVLHIEMRERVQQAVAKLTPGVHEVVALHYAGGLTIRETAEAMNLTEGTVKSRLHAALVELRSALE